MQVIEVQRYGGPEDLVRVERAEPESSPGRVRVRMAARAVNPVDIWTRTGGAASFTPGLALPIVLGWDIAGVVMDDAAGFTAGERVVGMLPWFQLATGEGTYAEVVAADPSWLVALPDAVPLVEAGTLPLNGLTAHQALQLLDVQSGGTVLVTGASGGVGGFAVQLAVSTGLRVLAVASHGDEKHVESLGAQQVLQRVDPATLVSAVRALVPTGVDGVLDAAAIGQPLVGASRDGGTFVGVTSSPDVERGIRSQQVQVAPDAGQLAELARQFAAGVLTTRIVDVLPLTDAADAHRHVAKGALRGKIVLTS